MKRIFVQFGVNIGGLKEAMAEHVSDLFEADSAPDHSRCRRVPKGMRAQPADRDSSEFEMAFRDGSSMRNEFSNVKMNQKIDHHMFDFDFTGYEVTDARE